MIPGRVRATCSTSSNVFSRPKDSRTKAFDSPSGTPIALMTWEGSKDPDEQADPADPQIPSRSKAAKRVKLSDPLTVKATVLGSTEAFGDRIETPNELKSSRTESSRVRSGFNSDSSKTGVGTNAANAAEKPTMPARFSVPARRSFS
jgi:hypothetical protein